MTVSELFWSKVDRTGGPDSCWPWMACRTDVGYGNIRIKQKLHLCHRMSWELVVGPIPEHMCVLHRCDNPPCVNPSHLFIGTKRHNTHDMIHKGRVARGEKHGMAILTTAEVLAIRCSADSHGSIAKQYGVSRGAITSIKLGKNWKHLP